MNWNFVVAAYATVITVFLGYQTYELGQKVSELEKPLQAMPPLAVVDFLEVARSLPPEASESDVNELMLKVNNATVKLKEAGYLILDRANIVHAPEDILVPISVIQNTGVQAPL